MTAQELLGMVKRAQEQTASQTSSTTSADQGCEQNLIDCGLDGVDCPICGNTGWDIRPGADPLEISVRECVCMRQRRSIRSIRNSCMAELLERYTLDGYVTDTEHRQRVMDAARRFLEAPEGWFYIAGQSGSGKTHICSGICANLILKGKEVRFVSWRDEAVALKALVTEREPYEARIGKLKKAPVLYIDDFLKGKVTDADLNLAFEILNARYNDRKLRTVISSELDIRKVLELDEAPPENWRLRKI